jgi:nucleoside-diphosphate-sugar epimerase
MDYINKEKPVLVTGGTGYIASWIIKFLLEDGYQVRTTVRDKNNKKKLDFIEDIKDQYKDKLTIFEADLLSEGSFDAAVEECELVIHAASPFKVQGIKDAEKELIEPARVGTKNVLESVNKADSVKRVVLTSSCAAIYGDNADINNQPNGIFTEEDWNTSSSVKHNPYPYSKTVAEKEAWKIQQSQDKWSLVVINPGLVAGPSLTKRKDSTSIDFLSSFLNGKYKAGIPDLWFAMVDVREVARAHIIAGTKEEAKGRHILVSESLDTTGIRDILKEKYGDYPLPKGKLPKLMLYIFGPLQGFTWKYVSRNVGIPIYFDNTYSQEDLGIQYRPVRETLFDQAEQLIRDKIV